MDRDTPVVILCGGQGTRIREVSERLPKAMVDIGGRPVLWHIMKQFSHYGFRRFILCLGYKGWDIKQFFLDYRAHLSDFTVALSQEHAPIFHDGRADESWEITFAETGLEAGTGARMRRIRNYVDTPSFMMTYADGVSSVNVESLVKTHTASGKIGTVTAIHPTSKYGELHVKDDQVYDFAEKPNTVEGWVSGGFFVFEKSFLDDYLDDDPNLFLEQGPLQRLARDGQLSVHRHEAFWTGMDTFKEYTFLNELWSAGNAPWKVWEDDYGY